MYIKTSDFAMENNVLFLSFAPHTTHKMQPLDVPVYWPLKLVLSKKTALLKSNIVCHKVNQHDTAKLFASA